MKRFIALLVCLLFTFSLVACGGGAESKHTISWIGSEVKDVPLNDEKIKCVCIYTDYTNNSGETVVPADYVNVKAFQNGVELNILVFTGEKMGEYIQCDTSVQTGTSAKLVWIFELDDSSSVSVELSNGEKQTIQIG